MSSDAQPAANLALDRVFAPQRDVPRWSETAWLGTWNPDAGVGLFVHVGRCQQDLDLWWAQTIAYLPDGRLAVDRSFGRAPDAETISTGNLTIRIDQPGQQWSASFDGAAELTRPEALARGLSGAGPARPMTWRLQTNAAAPMWNLFGGHDHSDFAAAGTHTQQGFRVTGDLSIDGHDYSLDGVGYNDHSSGARSMAQFGSHHFIVAVFPDRVLHSLRVISPDGAPVVDTGAVLRDDRDHPITGSSLAAVSDLLGSPTSSTLTITTGEGTEELQLEVLHTAAVTITEDGDNLNGTDWDTDEDIPILVECAAQFTTADGTIGYGHLERSIRRSTAGSSGA